MNREELSVVLVNHAKWLQDESTGTGADLREADLRGANLCEADLRGANLRGADLREADLDFSCLPLSCGGLKWKIDRKLAVQLIYHLCSMEVGDEEVRLALKSLVPLANQMHRTDVPRLS